MTETQTEFVQSADGTRIAVDRSGDGPAVVLAYGAFCDRSSSKPLAALLAPRFTVYEYDRRGRGDSGDAPVYAIEREVEDLDAVVRAAGGSAFAFGHSSGGALVLEAAARGVPLTRIAVYEPPYTGADTTSPEFADALDELASRGQTEQAAERFLGLTGMPQDALEQLKRGPHWPSMTALAHTLSRDLRLGNEGAVPLGRLAGIEAPVLAMAGGASYGWAHEAAETIAGALPHGENRILEGQGHAVDVEALSAILEEFFA